MASTTYKKRKTRSNNKSDHTPSKKKQNKIINKCVICLDALNNKHTKFDCGHKFHSECIKNWMFKETGVRGCPICRNNIYIQAINELNVIPYNLKNYVKSAIRAYDLKNDVLLSHINELKNNYENELEERKKAAGDVCNHFLNENGDFLIDIMKDKIISIENISSVNFSNRSWKQKFMRDLSNKPKYDENSHFDMLATKKYYKKYNNFPKQSKSNNVVDKSIIKWMGYRLRYPILNVIEPYRKPIKTLLKRYIRNNKNIKYR